MSRPPKDPSPRIKAIHRNPGEAENRKRVRQPEFDQCEVHAEDNAKSIKTPKDYSLPTSLPDVAGDEVEERPLFGS